MKENQPTVMDIIEEVSTEFCNEYCRWPFEYDDEDELMLTKCENCPLNKLR